MKRYVLIAIILIGLLGVGFAARMAMAVSTTSTSGITCTIPLWVSVQGLAAINVPSGNFSYNGTNLVGSNTDAFTVVTNARVDGTLGAEVTTQISGLTGTPLAAGLSASTINAWHALTNLTGTTAVTLTATVTVGPEAAEGNYSGGVITVTATVTTG